MPTDSSMCEGLCHRLGSHLEDKRDTPQINGSSGAFIAVIVCLVLVIVVACSAIFYLLRDHRVFDAEQAFPKRNHAKNKKAPQSTPSSSHAPWTSRLLDIFKHAEDVGVGHSATHTQTQRRGGVHGWIQAGSTDEWDNEGGAGRPGPSDVREATSVSPSSSRGTPSPHAPSPISRSTSDSASSARTSDIHGVRSLGLTEIRSPHMILPNIHSQLSSPSTSPQSSNLHLRTVSPDPLSSNVRFDNDSREYVGSSGVVMRTLPGGTKFVEDL